METQNKMQMEFMKSVPINYDIAMKIFNKYYTKEIQKKFISKHNLKIEKFYELSGLNKLVKNETQKAIINKKIEMRGDMMLKFVLFLSGIYLGIFIMYFFQVYKNK